MTNMVLLLVAMAEVALNNALKCNITYGALRTDRAYRRHMPKLSTGRDSICFYLRPRFVGLPTLGFFLPELDATANAKTGDRSLSQIHIIVAFESQSRRFRQLPLDMETCLNLLFGT
jgi:hypothetical protein